MAHQISASTTHAQNNALSQERLSNMFDQENVNAIVWLDYS